MIFIVAMSNETVDQGKPPDKRCKICGKFAAQTDIKCCNELCDTVVHTKCFDLISRVVDVDKNNFKCKLCCSKQSNGDVEVRILRKEIECLIREKEIINKYVSELEFNNELLKAEFVKKQSSSVQKPVTKQSFSEVIKNKSGSSGTISNVFRENETIAANTSVRNVPASNHVLLVKSNTENKENNSVVEDIKAKFRPAGYGIDISRTKKIKNGMLINCFDSNSLKILKTRLSEELGQQFNVYEPKKINPRIILYSVEENPKNDPDFLRNLVEDNQMDINSGDMRIVSIVKYRNVFNVIIEINANTFKNILNRGFLIISWKKCFVKECFSLPRCYKCCKIGHLKKDCRNTTLICPKCSGNHEMKECKSEVICCNNCKELNTRIKNKVSTDHTVNDPCCRYYLDKLEHLKDRINYG